MRVAIAQLNQVLGDLAGNAARLKDAVAAGQRGGADLVVTPELSLCGYPPEDLLLRPAFLDACAADLTALASEVRGVTALIGFPEAHDGRRHNAAPATSVEGMPQADLDAMSDEEAEALLAEELAELNRAKGRNSEYSRG